MQTARWRCLTDGWWIRLPPECPQGVDVKRVVRELELSGVTWNVSEIGTAGRTLLCLPGAMGAIDAMRPALDSLARDRTIFTVNYPPFPTMTAFCDGLAELLDALGRDRVDVLGSSFGGYVAQCLVRRHPHRGGSLVLAHTYVLTPRDARKLRAGIWLAPRIPRAIFERLAALKLQVVLQPVRRSNPSSYAALVSEIRSAMQTSLSPAAVQRNNEWMLESIRSFPFAPGDLRPAPRRILIVESDNDPVLRSRARAAVRAMYPHARVKTFHGTGHVTALAEPSAFAAEIAEFLGAGERT